MTKIRDLAVKDPSVEVRTLGAWRGSGGEVSEITSALRDGPGGCGAVVSGPACYGKGRSSATLIDANAVLGYLPRNFLGKTFSLVLEAARKPCAKVGDDLNVRM